MRLLDLFCGGGGAAMGFHRAGFEVIGVDIAPQPNYPFEFIQADALDVLRWFNNRRVLNGKLHRDQFDAIHASPPCQKWSRRTFSKEEHPDLITPLRPLLQDTGLPYVIENVPEAPLKDPIQLCGSSFGLDVRRHRLFESNVKLYDLPCRHEWQKPRFRIYDHGRWYLTGCVPVFGTGGRKAKEHWPKAMGIDWMTNDELREAIPPAYTYFLGKQIIARLQAEVARAA